MATKLTYPPLSNDGNRYNVTQKIFYKIGYITHTYTTSQITVFLFEEDLTPEEIAEVDAIMADPNTAQDSIQFAMIGNRLIVRNILDWKDEIEAACGFNVSITFRRSGLKGNSFDELVLQGTDPTYQMEKILTNTNKRDFLAAVEGLIRVE